MGALQPAKNSDEDVGALETATGFIAGVESVTSPGAFCSNATVLSSNFLSLVEKNQFTGNLQPTLRKISRILATISNVASYYATFSQKQVANR